MSKLNLPAFSHKLLISLGGIALTGALIALPAPAGQADDNPTALEMAAAIAGPGVTVTGADYVYLASPESVAVVNKPIGLFPRDGGTYAILSSGIALDVFEADTADDEGTEIDSDTEVRGGAYDTTTLKINFTVPEGFNCLSGVDFAFYSEEYPDFVGKTYNDALIIELDHNTWSVSGARIDAPDNIAFDETGSPITVNDAGVSSMTASRAAGTTFGGATNPLTTAAPAAPGPHTLYVTIFDNGDAIYDSAALIDNLRVGKVDDPITECRSGAVLVGQRVDVVYINDEAPEGENPTVVPEDGIVTSFLGASGSGVGFTEAKAQAGIPFGYDFVSLENVETYDADPAVDQVVTVHLKPQPAVVTVGTTHTIHYVGAGAATPADHVEPVEWAGTLNLEARNRLYAPAAEAVARKIDVPAVAGFTPDKTQVPVVPVSEPTTVEPTSITTVVTYTADSGAMLPATGASESTVSAGRTAALMVGAGFIFAAVVYRRGAFRSQP